MSLHPFFFLPLHFWANLFFHKFKDGDKNFLWILEWLNEKKKKREREKPFATKLELIIARHHLCRFDRIPQKQRKRGIHSRVHSSIPENYRLRNKWKLGYELRTINERTNERTNVYESSFTPNTLVAFDSLISSREGAWPTRRENSQSLDIPREIPARVIL